MDIILNEHVTIFLNGHVTILSLDLLLPCCSDYPKWTYYIYDMESHVNIILNGNGIYDIESHVNIILNEHVTILYMLQS